MQSIPGQSSAITLQENHFLGPHVDCNKRYLAVRRVTVIFIQQLWHSQKIIQENNCVLVHYVLFFVVRCNAYPQQLAVYISSLSTFLSGLILHFTSNCNDGYQSCNG